jgi:hypothetical protein
MRTTNRLGCLSGTGIIAAVITVFVIAGYVYAQGGLLYNPGPLNAQAGQAIGGVTSHAETGGNCKACHTAPWEKAKMEDRCADCHGGIAIQMKDVASVHGKILHDNPELGCRHCHPEHRGASAPLVVLGDAEFPHDAVGYSMKGHQVTSNGSAFTCDDCHQGDITTFALDSCQACHRQIDSSFTLAHSLSYGDSCLDCHDGVDRFGESFKHASSFNLTGKHFGVICTKCHTDVRVLTDFSQASTDCISCHRKDDPHETRFGTDCGACHTSNGWKPAKFDHNLAAFKLEGKHTEVECEQCHTDGSYKGTPSDCYSCHKQDDEHNGRFGTDCAACHQPTDWDATTFDHNKSRFPLTGRHTGLACEQCHINLQFKGLVPACAACHVDPAFHAGMFGLDCGACHNTNDWFAKYTGPHPGIADEGGRGVNHGGASCRDCHTQTLSQATCTACHDRNESEGGGGGGDD